MSIKRMLAAQPELKLRPALSEEELRAFEKTLPGKLPAEVAELLRYTAGFHSECIGEIDFTATVHRFEFKEIAPHGIALAVSNEGNFWVVDIHENGDWGNVFFFCHDPPVAIIQFDTLLAFTEAALGNRRINDEANRLACEVWENSQAGLIKADAVGLDPQLRAFAESLPDNFRIFDLRDQAPLKGFAWGRHGPDMVCKRASFGPIFAVEERPAKKGLFARLFG